MSATHDAPVEDLIRDLGALRVAADAVHAETAARTAIERAIWEATHAIGELIRDPDSPIASEHAQEVIRLTARLISALQTESARARRLGSIAAGLRLQGRTRREAKA